MQCPRCESTMPDYALFCGRCGTPLPGTTQRHRGKHALDARPASFSIARWERIPSATHETDSAATAGKQDAKDSPTRPVRKASSRFSRKQTQNESSIAAIEAVEDAAEGEQTDFWSTHWKVPLVVLIALALVAALVVAVPLVREQISLHSDQHHVTFVIRAPGYNNAATPLPVQVTGTTAAGRVYDELTFLDGGGNGIVLEPGTYTLAFPGGSILANGTALVAPDTTLEVTVPQGLPRNAFVQLPPDQAIEYTAVAPLDTTEELLNGIYLLASSKPGYKGRASALLEHASQAHEDALAKSTEHAAQLQRDATGKLMVSPGDTAHFLGTLEICSPEKVAERLQDENIQWNLYGRTLAVLWLDEERDLEFVNHEMQGAGWYDDEGNYHEDEVYTERYEMSCLLLDDDVEGAYSYGKGDDGTLSKLDGEHVLVSGKVRAPDWSESLISPVMLANPNLEAA